MSVFKYIKYSFYDWAKAICGKEFDWKDCKHFDEAREEAIAQIDVQFLLKRINQLEEVNRLRLSEGEEIIMGLTETMSLEKMRNKRKVAEYSEKIMQGRAGLTIDTLDIMGSAVGNLFNASNSLLFKNDTELNDESQKEFQEVIQLKESKVRGNPKQEASFVTLNRIFEEQKNYLQNFFEEEIELEEEEQLTEQSLKETFEKLP